MKMWESWRPGSSFLVLLIAGILLSTQDVLAQERPELLILPSQPVQTKPIGKPVLLTCRPSVQRELITDLRWTDPRGEPVRNDRLVYTEQLPGDSSLALIIRNLRESEAGNYTCSATFANSERLVRTVRIETIVAITWEDAPEEQYPILNSDYKVKCKVTANPAPIVDWLKNTEIISTGDHYVIDPDGLLIRKVTEADDGVYVCRAIVLDTGELQERHINVEVHTPPTFEHMQSEAEVVEGDSGSITCVAKGKPAPTYTWVRAGTQQDLSSGSRFSSNPQTGVLTINPAERTDRGQYQCRARNAAGVVERTVGLSVVVRPHIDELINVSAPVDAHELELKCVVSGWPLPTVTFQRVGSPIRMVPGAQPGDDRIVVDQERLPPKTQDGEERTQGRLIISGVLRSDDGLYSCVATNKGGEALKNGHVTVEFPPSFANTPLKEAWSWDNHPVNITCLAESIPNATITWRLNDREIDRDANVFQMGSGPESVLRVTPIHRQYYGAYKCRASNIHGTAEHEILLREAHPPSEILQAKLEVITATTITFLFIGPKDDGGLPTRSYAVQYKEERRNWNEAMNKTWLVDSPYILEGLEPQVSYQFRFAARNDVGFGNWAADEHHTMPKRSNPEEPRILNNAIEGVAMSPYFDHFELRWRIPADNGEEIDKYDIKYCIAQNSTEGWKESDKCEVRELPSQGPPTFQMVNLRSDVFYKVELRAHNAIGYSTPGQVVIKTAKDPTKAAALAPYPSRIFRPLVFCGQECRAGMGEEGQFVRGSAVGAASITEVREPALTSAAIIGIIVAALILVFIIVDVSCFLVNSTGLTHLLVSMCRPGSESETAKGGSGEKEPLKGPTLGLNTGKESSVLMIADDRLKKDTEVEYDPKRDGARILMAKHSAV